jgi:hypothetical protein
MTKGRGYKVKGNEQKEEDRVYRAQAESKSRG